jgi:hypothetical protein
MDNSVPTPAEPEWLRTAAGTARSSDAAADALEAFCSDSLRSIDRTVMRAQVIELILDILATTDVQSEARQRLLHHLALHPGSPEQALLCHLSENACLPPATGSGNPAADDFFPAGGDYFPADDAESPPKGGGRTRDGLKPKWLPAPLRNLLRHT